MKILVLVIEFFTADANNLFFRLSLERMQLNSTVWVASFNARDDDRRETYRGADKSLARPGRKQATATKL